MSRRTLKLDVIEELIRLKDKFAELTKEYARLKEAKEIESRYPPQPGQSETKTWINPLITSPTESTETKVGVVGAIPTPLNNIESAINRLREQARGL